MCHRHDDQNSPHHDQDSIPQRSNGDSRGQGAETPRSLLSSILDNSHTYVLLSWGVFGVCSIILTRYVHEPWSIALMALIWCFFGMSTFEAIASLYVWLERKTLMYYHGNYTPTWRDILAMAADIVKHKIINRYRRLHDIIKPSRGKHENNEKEN